MKVLIALPIEHKSYGSIEDIIQGNAPVNGTDGSFFRVAALLADAGIDVCLSAAAPVANCPFPAIRHSEVKAEDFDQLIVHQTHWDGTSLTFGNLALPKTSLWFHVQSPKRLVFNFVKAGGNKIVCPSQYLAKWFRVLPGWWNKVAVIPNPYSPLFEPMPKHEVEATTLPRLLFIGALGPAKGLLELTQIWSYLAEREVPLEFAIAGSIDLHYDNSAGAVGLAEPHLEETVIQPWLKSLPEEYQPKFLGSLSPSQLKLEIAKCWAVLVNPSYLLPETFCVAGIEAEACDRTVFSLRAGALPETIYHETFNSLAEGNPVEGVAECIIKGLCNEDLVAENGKQAGSFVRRQFNSRRIGKLWIDLLNGQPTHAELPKFGDNLQGVVRDLIRWGRLWTMIDSYRELRHRLQTSKQASK
jgi:glycosyltransferase involved in cell wall biosynthesis